MKKEEAAALSSFVTISLITNRRRVLRFWGIAAHGMALEVGERMAG